MDAERRLLDYLWNTALIERLRVAGNDGKVAVHVRDLFGPDDPLTADIDSALAAPAYRCPVEGFHEHRFDGPHGLAAPAVTKTGDLRAALPELTGPVLARAWLLSGRSAPLLELDEWDGFALTVRAILETDRAAALRKVRADD